MEILRHTYRKKMVSWNIYITFKNRKHLEVTSIMKDICMILKIDSYCLCENYTQSIIDIEGDVIAFADFSEKQE